MIVRTRDGGSRELRAGPIFGQRIPTPAEYGSWVAATGEPVTVDKAAGLPAVLNAIRLIAESGASLPLRVYRGQGADKRTQERTWQWRLLHDMPNDEQSPFDFWQDVFSSVESWGDAFIHKVKITRGAVDAMFVIDPAIVTVQRNWRTNEKEFHIRGVENPDRRENQTSVDLVLTASEVLHVRGFTLKGGDRGMSPIRLARENLAAGLARQSYVNHFFRNDASPPGAIRVPDKINRQQGLELMQIWNMYHQGTHQAGQAGLLTAGAEWVKFGVPLEDAQFVESEVHAVKDVARMFSLPPSTIGGDSQGDMEQETTRLLSFGLGPRLSRVQSAFRADPDFFGSGELYPEFFVDDFIRVDAATKAEVRHKDVQSGVLLPDEARADKGLPPLPDGAGKVPQITPVGGAPNPNAAPAATNGANGGVATANLVTARVFNEGEHPRDDDGKFAGKGGGAGGAGDGDGVGIPVGQIKTGQRLEFAQGKAHPSGKEIADFRGVVARKSSDGRLMVNAGTKSRPRWVLTHADHAREITRKAGDRNDNRRDYLKNLTDDEVAAIKAYQSESYTTINRVLRNGEEPGPATAKRIRSLDSAVAKGVAGKEQRVYRAAAGFGNDPSQLVGKTYTDHGFVSTSETTELPLKMASSRGRGAVYARIMVPKGASVGYLHKVDPRQAISKYGGILEREMLLPRGSEFKVTAAKQDADGMWTVDMELVIA